MADSLRTEIRGDADDLTARGVVPLVASYGLQHMVIGDVCDFVSGVRLTGVLKFRDDHVGRTAQRMFAEADRPPEITQSYLGCMVNF